MHMKKDNSILYKIFSSTTVILFFISIIIFCVILVLFPLSYRQSIDAQNIENSKSIATMLQSDELTDVQSILNYYEGYLHTKSAILDANGQIMYMSNTIAENVDLIESVVEQKNSEYIEVAVDEGSSLYNVKQSLLVVDGKQYILVTLMYVEPVMSLIRPFMLMFPILTAIILVQSLLIAYIVSTIMTKPISILSKKANAITHLQFDNEYKWNSNDEFGRLSDDLDETQTKMKQVISYLEDDAFLKNQIALEEQRQQISILSHELNTPLTVLKMQTELLKNQATDEMSIKYLERNLTKVDEVTSLVDQILNYKSLDDSQIINVRQFLEDIINANYGGQVFSYDYRADLEVDVSPLYLTRLLTNLINNAIKYNFNNQPINVVLDEKTIIIQNVHAPDLIFNKEEILKPYVRANNISRVNGQGLGLYICRRICILNGFGLDITSENQIFSARVLCVHEE